MVLLHGSDILERLSDMRVLLFELCRDQLLLQVVPKPEDVLVLLGPHITAPTLAP